LRRQILSLVCLPISPHPLAFRDVLLIKKSHKEHFFMQNNHLETQMIACF